MYGGCTCWCSMTSLLLLLLLLLCMLAPPASAIRLAADLSPPLSPSLSSPSHKIAVFALGSFWRAEAVFGCLKGVIRTTAGYTGGSKTNPEYRNVGDHAEAVEVEYDPNVITYEQLLEHFWENHDPTQVLGQGPDVGYQYRSAIFVDGREQQKLASMSKAREETKLMSGVLTTEIEPLGFFYSAEAEHQKFELRRKVQLMQLLGTISEDELTRSRIATKLNAYVAGMCPLSTQKEIDKVLDQLLDFRPILLKVLQR